MSNNLFSSQSTDDSLHIANGLTSVFISTFGLSASILTATASQKELTLFILEKDQTCLGRGAIFFALTELPWRKESFREDQQFLLDALDGIMRECGWKKLSYQPNKELLAHAVEKSKELISGFPVNEIDENARMSWLQAAETNDPVYQGFPKCPIHNVYLTLFGCQLCNEQNEMIEETTEWS